MTESFLTKIQVQNRVKVPMIVLEKIGAKEGDMVRMTIEKVKK